MEKKIELTNETIAPNVNDKIKEALHVVFAEIFEEIIEPLDIELEAISIGGYSIEVSIAICPKPID